MAKSPVTKFKPSVQASSSQIQALLFGAGNSIVLLGDSRQAASSYTSGVLGRYDYQGWFVAMNQSMGAPFDIRANLGTGGVTSAVMRSVQLPQALALNPRPRLACIDVGYNDAQTGRAYLDTVADVTATIVGLTAAGIQVILTTSIPGDTLPVSTAGYVNLCAYNRWVLTTGALLPSVLGVIDLHSMLMDPTTGVLKTTYKDAAGIHLNAAGSAIGGIGASTPMSKLTRMTPTPFLGAFDATAQLLPNPRMIGSSGTGIGVGTTGTLPTKYASSRNGTATGVYSQVARPDTLAGTRTKIAHTGGARGDSTVLAADNFNLLGYVQSFTYGGLYDRIRPTVPNGRQYLVVATGATSAAADPTGSWSTVLGTTFTVNGTLQVKVVESIDIGDTVQLVTEVWMDSFNGAALVLNNLFTLTGGYSGLFTGTGGFADNATTAYPTLIPAYQVIKSYPFVLLPTTQVMNVTISCVSDAAVTGNWYVGRCELQKYV